VTVLLDGNILIALTLTGHVQHETTASWMAARTERFATTPITQGTLLRTVIRLGATAGEAVELLEQLTGSAAHEFWPDDLPYSRRVLEQVGGHADVTDAYLAASAAQRRGRVATIDRRFASRYPDVVELVVEAQAK
jgi:uncharacterized protein